MATFTEDPSYVYEEEVRTRTQLIEMEDGSEVRNSYGTMRRVFTLNYDMVTETIRDTIVAFFEARESTFDTFSWTNPNDDTSYTVRFVRDTLNIRQSGYQLYNMQFQFIEVI